mmetsp:Transcript_4124/g.16925  ORF Transcript_4124/g.16925 Transcript_4124/m.16925 type:complete len:235 (-) Transcript_4124:1009-1713(-)
MIPIAPCALYVSSASPRPCQSSAAGAPSSTFNAKPNPARATAVAAACVATWNACHAARCDSGTRFERRQLCATSDDAAPIAIAANATDMSKPCVLCRSAPRSLTATTFPVTRSTPAAPWLTSWYARPAVDETAYPIDLTHDGPWCDVRARASHVEAPTRSSPTSAAFAVNRTIVPVDALASTEAFTMARFGFDGPITFATEYPLRRYEPTWPFASPDPIQPITASAGTIAFSFS